MGGGDEQKMEKEKKERVKGERRRRKGKRKKEGQQREDGMKVEGKNLASWYMSCYRVMKLIIYQISPPGVEI